MDKLIRVMKFQFGEDQFFGSFSKIKPYELVTKESLLGKSIRVYIKEGAAFNYKVTECGLHHFGGYDDEGMNISIAYEDIDFIIGGN